LPPEARVFHIGQEGRPASHFFLYRIADDDGTVQVLRVLYKSMDAPRHLPKKS
jgi:plasmid stabilization system protein ParE